jgi:hypothetical protein
MNIKNVELLGKCRWSSIIGKTNIQILCLLVGFAKKDIERCRSGIQTGTHQNARACLSVVVTQGWRYARSHDVRGLEVDPAGNSVLHLQPSWGTGTHWKSRDLYIFIFFSITPAFSVKLSLLNWIRLKIRLNQTHIQCFFPLFCWWKMYKTDFLRSGKSGKHISIPQLPASKGQASIADRRIVKSRSWRRSRDQAAL